MSAPFPTASRSRPLSLDDVILLNDEIQGLIAAGIPLNVGLAGFASRVPGRLRAFSERLATRLAAGEPLEQALQAESAALPGEYQVVIAAGLRSGRFDEALASVSRYAAGLRDLRAGLRRALIYPGVVCGLAFGLLVAVFTYVVPLLTNNVDALQIRRDGWYWLFEALHRSVLYWGLGIPLLVLLMVLVPWTWQTFIGGRSGARRATQLYLYGWRWVPGVAGALRAAHWSRFAHLLSVLLDAGTPFEEAARLSAAAVGDARVVAVMDRARVGIRRGASLSETFGRRSGVPPLLRWLLCWGERDTSLAPALREAAAQYAQRALIRAELVQRFLPLVVVALVGGGITAVYALTVFVPLTSLWEQLANSH